MSNTEPAFSSIFTIRAPRTYGWKKSLIVPTPDQFYVPSFRPHVSMPTTVDMRPQDTAIYNQTTLGSCVSNGGLGNAGFVCRKDYGFVFNGSRLQTYYDGRVIEKTVDQDSGLEVRDIVTVLQNIGACPESEWPYDVSNFRTKPTPQCYEDAKKFKILKVLAVQQDLSHIKSCLADGFPFIFGFNVPESFESSYTARTGIMTMPKPGEQIVGGHCVMGIGFIDAAGNMRFSSAAEELAYHTGRAFVNLQHAVRVLTGVRLLRVSAPTNVIICRNSWGTGWGDEGYFYMPYDFIVDPKQCSDFWSIQKMTNPKTGA
jgi:C1A family cysteine protease